MYGLASAMKATVKWSRREVDCQLNHCLGALVLFGSVTSWLAPPACRHMPSSVLTGSQEGQGRTWSVVKPLKLVTVAPAASFKFSIHDLNSVHLSHHLEFGHSST